MANTFQVWNIQMLQLFKRVRMEATVWNLQVLQLMKENVNGERGNGRPQVLRVYMGVMLHAPSVQNPKVNK